jgi:hypothetical protein
LLIFIAAMVITFVISDLASGYFAEGFPLALFAIVHGLVAALLAKMCRMAWWWSVILGVFPILALLVQALQLPPILFLIVFLVLLVVFWTTYRNQVPYFPSGLRVWRCVEEVLPKDKPFTLIDIGSGFGGAVMYWSSRHAQGVFSGIEHAPLPWLYSAMLARFKRSRAKFIRGDFTKINLAKYDVVFAYLSPAAMPDLWEKALSEMVKGSLLLSYEFVVEEKKPDIVIKTRENGETLYGWIM